MKSCCHSCATGEGPCEAVEKSHKDKLPGGIADKKDPEDFDADQLALGMAHELEHTKDETLAMEIAMDHLASDENYYTKLRRIEKTQAINWKIRKNFKVVRKTKFQGLDISIEHDKGMVRHWKDDASGEEGKTKMHYPYGYICRTDGADGDQVDVYIGPNSDEEKVFVVHQMKKPNFVRYDEDKVMVGFSSRREAKAAYLMHFDDPRFLGTITDTDITAFKRMFVKKSIEHNPLNPTYAGMLKLRGDVTQKQIDTFKSQWNEQFTVPNEELVDLQSCYQLMKSAEGDLSKGLLDQLGKVWAKVKEKFGGTKEDKPKKKWVKPSNHHCKTGVCDRLNGTEIDIDDTFTAMKGMQVDGPPGHKYCQCHLEFSMGKSLDTGYYPEEQDMTPPAPEGPPMVAPMMPMMPVDPHDVETFEGAQALLRTIGSAKDPELMQIASKIWGDGYTFEGLPPEVARAEIIGFLLDQRDLLGVVPEEPTLQPSPSLPNPTQIGSSEYSPQSATQQNANPSPEAGSIEEVSPEQSLIDWFTQDSSQKKEEQEFAPTN